jgi:hypothetical protein
MYQAGDLLYLIIHRADFLHRRAPMLDDNAGVAVVESAPGQVSVALA